MASNDEESEDEDGGDVDEEGNEVKKSKLKKEKKEKKRLVWNFFRDFFVDHVRMACNYGLFCRRRKRIQEEGDENAPKKKRFVMECL